MVDWITKGLNCDVVNMLCVLCLDEKDIKYNCTPNDCDRLGCKLNNNYDPKEQLEDMDFSKPGKYSISSIIHLLIISSLFVAILLRYIIINDFSLLSIILSLFISTLLIFSFYEVIYKTNKYWNENYEKINKEIEKRLSNG